MEKKKRANEYQNSRTKNVKIFKEVHRKLKKYVAKSDGSDMTAVASQAILEKINKK